MLTRVYNRAKSIVRKVRSDLSTPRISSVINIPDNEFLKLFSLPAAGELSPQKKCPESIDALIKHYNDRASDSWPSPPDVITDLRLHIKDLPSDKLLARAEAIVNHDISPDGRKPKVSADGKIDWLFNPVSSPEWLWRLNRHQWWPVLGLAYQKTKNERYAAAFVSQLVDWISKNPLPAKMDENSPTWRLMETGMRLRVSWIPCFSMFYNSPSFSDNAKFLMLKSMYDHAHFLSLYKTSQNHLLRESNGLAYFCVYFPECTQSEEWKQLALSRLEKELAHQVNHDGSQFEVSTGYQFVVIDEFEKTYELLQANNATLPTEDLPEWLEKMYQLLADLIRPDFSFPEINDGFIRWQHDRLADAGKHFNRDDFTYLGTAGISGSQPEHTSACFKDGGMFIMRSGWTEADRYLFFDAGPYGGFHGHEDKLSIEVYAYGQSFVVDSGSYTYEAEDPYRAYFVGSEGHNTVLVDGMSQIRRWLPEHMKLQTRKGNYAIWHSDDNFDYVSSTYKEGYGKYCIRRPQKAEIIRDVSHTRKILFVKPDYWLMVDELESSTTHNYQQVFHAHPETDVIVKPDNRVIITSLSTEASLHLISTDSRQIKIQTVRGCEDPIQGWYSQGHLRKIPSNALLFEKHGKKGAVFVTLLYPFPDEGKVACPVQLENIAVSEGPGKAVKVTTEKGSDYILFSSSKGMKRFGPYASESTVACIRTDSTGNVISRFEQILGETE